MVVERRLKRRQCKYLTTDKMDFITLHFKMATSPSQRDNPCEIGLTIVSGGQIVDTKSWLIKPLYNVFDDFSISMHGIRPEDVADKLEFNELWTEIEPLVLNKFLMSHNAGFYVSVLRKTLEAYKLPFPTLNYSCSKIFSKNVWQGLPSYDLKSLCNLNNIDLKHYRADAESKAIAELTLKAFEIAGVSSLDDFPEKLLTSVGKLYEGGYRPSETKRIRKATDLSKIVDDPTKHNVDSIFYGKTVMFTGELSSMFRVKAQQTIADIGGINGKSVTKDTDFLVVGQQDFRRVGEDGMSDKQEKAVKLIEKGSTLEILSEDDFLKNL